MESPPFPPAPARRAGAWPAFAAGAVRAFHAYANWLVGISWLRFALLSILLLVTAGMLSQLPPFTWTVSETVRVEREPVAAKAPVPPSPPDVPGASGPPAPRGKVQISIDEDGVSVSRPGRAAAAASQAASQAASAASAAAEAAAAVDDIRIDLPAGVDRTALREAIEEAKAEIRQAIEEARHEADEARRDASEAAAEAAAEAAQAVRVPRTRVERVTLGDFLPQFAMLWIIASMIVKITYKGRIQAEAKAQVATEAAEAESLKRQVVEARMAAMQAQVEPHFLFNTLASIDHLIETDPARASRMQRNLIALLRASMPTLREANAGGLRDLGRELAVVRPYLEILKVRMEERLTVDLQVPDGLLSAEFPPMMLQSLVENAIKHGLEPKPEGGSLRVAAEIVHGKLVVTVADTGLGFGKSPTAGTGIGLANIRERLQLLYGGQAALSVAANAPSGTRVTITVPYNARPDAAARAAA